jgi:hypothetical protein
VIFQAAFPGAATWNEQLRTLILDAEKTDQEAALFGGINAVKSSSDLLTWDHPAIGWIRDRIMDAVTALTQADPGDPGGPGDTSDAGYLQLLDPRPAAIARQVPEGSHRIEPVPGRMVAFPGWLPHSVQATATGDSMRIAIAWNVARDKTWRSVS